VCTLVAYAITLRVWIGCFSYYPFRKNLALLGHQR
jgi:hypothetical protein